MLIKNKLFLILIIFEVVFRLVHSFSLKSFGICKQETLSFDKIWHKKCYYYKWEITCCDGYSSPIRKRYCVALNTHVECLKFNDYGAIVGDEILKCKPICQRSCQNGLCVFPNTCECLKGYTKVNNYTCEPKCSNKCANGYCIAPEKCECHTGYSLNKTDKYSCEPVCKNTCINGYCKSPDVCECNQDYKKLANNSSECVISCDNDCEGKHNVLNETKCSEGYVKDKNPPYICIPKCEGCLDKNCTYFHDCQYEDDLFNTTQWNKTCEMECKDMCFNKSCSYTILQDCIENCVPFFGTDSPNISITVSQEGSIRRDSSYILYICASIGIVGLIGIIVILIYIIKYKIIDKSIKSNKSECQWSEVYSEDGSKIMVKIVSSSCTSTDKINCGDVNIKNGVTKHTESNLLNSLHDSEHIMYLETFNGENVNDPCGDIEVIEETEII